MKKNLYACIDRHRKVMKLILMMKATFILSVLFALQVHAGVYSQQVRLSMNLEKATNQTSYRGDQAEHGIQFRV